MKGKTRARGSDATDIAAEVFLGPVIEFAKVRGNKVLLAEELAKTGAKSSRWHIERWLHPLQSRRQHCSLGSGLLLMRAYQQLVKKNAK